MFNVSFFFRRLDSVKFTFSLSFFSNLIINIFRSSFCQSSQLYVAYVSSKCLFVASSVCIECKRLDAFWYNSCAGGEEYVCIMFNDTIQRLQLKDLYSVWYLLI